MKKKKNFIKTAAVFVSALIMISCQNPSDTSDDSLTEGGNQNSNKTEYTVSFNANCPETYSGELFYSCSESAPQSITAEEGSYITLPSFSGELTKYVNNEEEGIYPFATWNTASDGNGESYTEGAGFQVTQNVKLYAIYSPVKKSGGNDDSSSQKPDGDYLDLSTTSEYSMKIGEKIQLYAENADTYTVTTGTDVVSIGSDNVLEATGAGNATVQVSIKNSVKTYSIVITVTADTTNSFLDSELYGKWTDGESYLQFNSDGTGYLYFKNGSLNSLDCSCSWTSTTYANGTKYLVITNATSSSNGSYEYSVSGSTLSLKGRMAFGMAESTTWTKN